MKIKPFERQPIGRQQQAMFLDGTRGGKPFGCFTTTQMPVYESDKRSPLLRKARREAGLGLRGLATLLDITPLQASGLERGSYGLATDEQWDEAFRLIEQHRTAGFAGVDMRSISASDIVRMVPGAQTRGPNIVVIPQTTEARDAFKALIGRLHMDELTERQLAQLDDLKERLEKWYRAMVKANPDLTNGEDHTFELIAGRTDSHQNEPLFSIAVKTSVTETGL